jgi:hypothetical protein
MQTVRAMSDIPPIATEFRHCGWLAARFQRSLQAAPNVTLDFAQMAAGVVAAAAPEHAARPFRYQIES